MKVDFSNLNPDPNRVILVEDATMKPLAMLKYFIKIGYIPGKVRFFDDRISNFDGIAEELSDLLHTDVSFYEALPDEAKQSVRVVKYVSEKIASSLPIEESPFRIQTTDQKPLPNEMH